MDEKYIRPEEASRLLKVTVRTLLNWDYKGKVKCVRTKGGHRRFLLSDILERLPKEKQDEYKTKTQRKVCYGRIPARAPKSELERQVKYFQAKFPEHEIITDLGSGISFKRKGFNSLLDSAIKGDIGEIVVTHKDRLCRFGFELVERIVSTYSNGKIVVLNQEETSPEKELVNDLLSIITVFSSRLYGLKNPLLRREIRKEIQNGKKGKEIKDVEISPLSVRNGERENTTPSRAV